MCGATEGGLSLDGIDVAKEAIIQCRVTRGEEPVRPEVIASSGLAVEVAKVVVWRRTRSASVTMPADEAPGSHQAGQPQWGPP